MERLCLWLKETNVIQDKMQKAQLLMYDNSPENQIPESPHSSYHTFTTASVCLP